MATIKMPKRLATVADKYFQARADRLAMQKQLDELKEKEAAYRDHLINELPKSDATGIAGKLCRVAVVTKPKPTVKDWFAFHKYIKRTGSFELLQRRVSEQAVKERWDDGKKVPGVETFDAVSLSVSKL